MEDNVAREFNQPCFLVLYVAPDERAGGVLFFEAPLKLAAAHERTLLRLFDLAERVFNAEDARLLRVGVMRCTRYQLPYQSVMKGYGEDSVAVRRLDLIDAMLLLAAVKEAGPEDLDDVPLEIIEHFAERWTPEAQERLRGHSWYRPAYTREELLSYIEERRRGDS